MVVRNSGVGFAHFFMIKVARNLGVGCAPYFFKISARLSGTTEKSISKERNPRIERRSIHT